MCTPNVSENMARHIEAHGWKGSWIVWAVGKIGIVKYAQFYEYEPVNVKSGKSR